MRLFVAVDPPASEVEALDAAIGTRDPRLRWVAPAQWHLTVVFCAEVDAKVVPDLTARLQRAVARTDRLVVRLTGAGAFPRVAYVGLTGDVEALGLLAARCAAAARRAGIEVDTRRFRPHLTIARSRGDAYDVREAVARLATYEGERWPVMAVRLVRSTLGAEVVHETLAEFPLRP